MKRGPPLEDDATAKHAEHAKAAGMPWTVWIIRLISRRSLLKPVKLTLPGYEFGC
jgi:hypothetical protein